MGDMILPDMVKNKNYLAVVDYCNSFTLIVPL